MVVEAGEFGGGVEGGGKGDGRTEIRQSNLEDDEGWWRRGRRSEILARRSQSKRKEGIRDLAHSGAQIAMVD